MITVYDLFSGHGITKHPDDAILFTNSGITVIVKIVLELFDVNLNKVGILKLVKIQKPLRNQSLKHV